MGIASLVIGIVDVVLKGPKQLPKGMGIAGVALNGLPRTRTGSADVYAAIAYARAIDRATWDRWALAQYPVGIP